MPQIDGRHRKGEDVPPISEENRLLYFLNLHSNEPLNPAQQNICNELRQNECHGQHSRPLDFMITEREIRKAAEKLKNNKSPFSDKTRRYGSVYLGVVVLRELYFEHALLQLNNCHHILPEKINPLLHLFAEPHSLYSMSQSTTKIVSFHDNV